MSSKSTVFDALLEEYILDKIDFASYRNRRSSLIKQFTLKNFPKDVTVPKGITSGGINKKGTSAQTTDTHTEFQIPLIKQKKSLIESISLQYLIVILLVLTGALSWYFSTNIDHSNVDEKTETTKNPSPSDFNNNSDNNRISEIKTTDEPFIVAFNEKISWDTENMSNFLIQWQSLSPSQQSSARKSPSFGKLSDILRQRIKQQRIISKEKTKKTSRRESLMIWFSSQLSIDIE